MKMTSFFSRRILLLIVASSLAICSTTTIITVAAFTPAASTAAANPTTTKKCPLFQKSTTTTSSLPMVATAPNKKQQPYKPKWVKKQTLAESGAGDITTLGHANVGLKGTIPVVFKQGNATITTKAWAGQPIRDVASQAGQYIQYGCGKGQCGTCECKMNGKWIRPCIETVPATAVESGELVLQIKDVKHKSKSSGTFFSIRSFFMGFWNNLLGMLGFVKFRKKATESWLERKQYEDSVKQRTLEKKLLRQQRELEKLNNNSNNEAKGTMTTTFDDLMEELKLEQLWNNWMDQLLQNNNSNNKNKKQQQGFHSTARRKQEEEEGLMWYV